MLNNECNIIDENHVTAVLPLLTYSKPLINVSECSNIINGGGPNISESQDGGGLYS